MNLKIEKNISLKDWNSWKVGGLADYFFQPKNLEELKEVYQWALEKNIPVRMLGKGSNVLIHDEGYRGLVLNDQYLNKISYEIKKDRLFIECESGVLKSELAKIFLDHKLAPASFLVGLPGSVGGGIVMNAGINHPSIKPKEFCEITHQIEVLKESGDLKVYEKKDLHFSYRSSSLWQPGIIYKVYLSWENKKDENLMTQVKNLSLKRRKSQPLSKQSSGSTFKNPYPYSSGQLIEECGLKGFSLGQAQISDIHANFIISNEKTKALEIKNLIDHIKKTVFSKKGIKLEEEIKYLGPW